MEINFKDNTSLLYSIFFVGLLSYFTVSMMGTLFVPELFFLVSLPFIFSNKSEERVKVDAVIFAIGIWLLSQIVSDFINGSEFFDLARGQSKILFLAINTIALSYFINNEEKIFYWLIGLCLAVVFTSAQLFEFVTLWKFGGCQFGLIAITAIILLLNKNESLEEKAKKIIVVCIVFFVISLYFNTRSSAGGCLIGAVALYYAIKRSKKDGKNNTNTTAIFIVIPICIYLLGFTYIKFAENGLLGVEAENKITAQRLYDLDPVVGMVAGGRAEIFSSLSAIADSPIIGHGSWAKNDKYTYEYVMAKIALGADSSDEDIKRELDSNEGLIPTHSHVFSAWVESGFLGFIFWISILVLTIKTIISSFLLEKKSDILILVGSFWFVWDILFSPFGAIMRLFWATYFVLFMLRRNNQ